MHNSYPCVTFRRYSSHPPVHTLLFLLLLLCCTVGCLAAIPRGCMYDKVNRVNMQTSVVREIPHKGQGAMQAYTASIPTNSKDKSNFVPIRIKAFTRDLDDPSKYCTKEGDIRVDQTYTKVQCLAKNVLTVRKKRLLLQWTIPAAIKLHTDRLLVQPVKGILKLRKKALRVCSWYHIPKEHFTEGLVDADLHLYISSIQSVGVAWASLCHIMENGRPFAAAMNLQPSYVEATESHIRIIAHEIAHALGFEIGRFYALRMISFISNVRGKPSVGVISAPKAKEIAQKYYNCTESPGLELEDEGGVGSIGSHFEKRNAKEELMSPYPEGARYSILLLSVFDSMPFYKANFSMAEPTRWGNNSGCGLLQKKCMENGKTEYPDMFCNMHRVSSRVYHQCTHDRMALGRCAIKRKSKALKPQYQYLWDKWYGGSVPYMDYCPYVVGRVYGSCINGNKSKIVGSLVGPDSRCVKGNTLSYKKRFIGDVCVKTKCKNGKLSVKFKGDKNWYQCEEGKEVKSNNETIWSGSIFCPKYDDVCIRFPNINNEEPLPDVTENDNETAPANITWVINKSQAPSPQTTRLASPIAEFEEKPSVNAKSVGSNTSKTSFTETRSSTKPRNKTRSDTSAWWLRNYSRSNASRRTWFN